MLRLLHSRTLAILLLCCVSINASAQATEELKIESVRLNPLLSELFINVGFSARLDPAHSEDLNTSNVAVTTRPSNTPLTVQKVSRVGLSPRRLQISFNPSALPAAASADTEFEICFTTLHFIAADGSSLATASRLCEKGTILSASNVASELEKQFKVLEQTEKTSEEKNIFASGFVVNGEGGNSEGGAEINLNSNDLGVRGLTAFMRLKKSTANEADPKHFEIGLNQSMTNLIGKGSLRQIREYRAIMLDSSKSPADREAAAQSFRDLLKKRQERLLGGMFFDFGGKLEAQALNFDVTNFVGEGSFQLQSRTKRLFGSTNGFVRFRLIPAGMELGYNVSEGAPADQTTAAAAATQNNDPDWIARFKFGGALTLFYKDTSETPGLLKRVELEVQAVDRYLFRREAMFDKTTMSNTSTDKGNKPWLQADFKIFFTDPAEGTPGGLRTGFKLSYQRGSLPPVFANTKSFQFGIVLESTESKK
jgi:hypothetical protein